MVNALLAEDFKPYIARNRQTGGFTFDMWIADPVAEEWYGGERSHDLPECVWLFWHIRAGMKVVHCGAHHGFLTIPFSKALVCNRIGNPHIESKTARLPISSDIRFEIVGK